MKLISITVTQYHGAIYSVRDEEKYVSITETTSGGLRITHREKDGKRKRSTLIPAHAFDQADIVVWEEEPLS